MLNVDLYSPMFVYPEWDDKNIADSYTESYENVRDGIESLHLAIVTLLEEQ
jgi:hypothetical protein